ncbi:hypothetical protein ACFFU9_08630 [Mariniflexile ostreae]|uniref:Uncharacterized protein n=1 Tax=Mariniflexile ostreae TaxID=1520892 RepID=A0ABV5FBN6_9FLAO
MKKITFLFVLLMMSFGFAQTIPVTFDSDIIVGSNWKKDSGLASVDIIDLPSDMPDHGNAGEIISVATGEAWQNAQLSLTSNYIDLTDATGNKVITVDVYAESTQVFLLKLEQTLNGTSGSTEKSFSHTGTGWETIAVDFSAPNAGQPIPNDQYKLLVFFPCYSNDFATPPFDSTTYIDNVSDTLGTALATPVFVIVDFEPEGIGSDWIWTATEVAPSLSQIGNPVSGGINTSAYVAEFVAHATDQNWALCFTSSIGEFTFDETNTTIKIMVYKPTISNVGIKFEGLSPAIEAKIGNTVINQREELTFDFSSQIGSAYNKLIIIPDFVETNRTTDNIIYFDNLQVPDGVITGSLPQPEAAATAPTRDETNHQVLSIFSDAYANISGTNYNPNWGQSTVATIEMVAGEEVLKYEGLNYQGTEYAEQNVSERTHLHVDYWTANATTLDFFLISEGQEKTYALPVSSKETWLSTDIPFNAFAPPVDLNAVKQFKLAGNGTIWFDSFYFYNDVSLSYDDVETLKFSVYPNPTKKG